jgi:hypothetical protein
MPVKNSDLRRVSRRYRGEAPHHMAVGEGDNSDPGNERADVLASLGTAELG